MRGYCVLRWLNQLAELRAGWGRAATASQGLRHSPVLGSGPTKKGLVKG